MTLPTIHLNGTSRDALVEQQCEVSSAIEEAILAMRRAAPNGRDYYPQGAGALEQAEKEHFARIQKLVDLKTEIDAYTQAIADS